MMYDTRMLYFSKHIQYKLITHTHIDTHTDRHNGTEMATY